MKNVIFVTLLVMSSFVIFSCSQESNTTTNATSNVEDSTSNASSNTTEDSLSVVK
jgi:ABC-type enterochelin transport system substrate-binding protein